MISHSQNFMSILVLAGLSIKGISAQDWLTTLMSLLVGGSVVYMNIKAGALKDAETKRILKDLE